MQIIHFLFPYKNWWVFQCRFGVWTEECQEYSRDTLNRNTGCWFPRTFINSKGFEQLAVHVNGSSKHAAIKPFDQLFAPHSIGKPDLTQHWNWAQSWYWKGSCHFSNIKQPYNQHGKKIEAFIRPLTHLKCLTGWFGNVGTCSGHGKMLSGLPGPIHEFSNSYLSCWFPSPSCDYSNLKHILLRAEFSPVENNCTRKTHSSAYLFRLLSWNVCLQVLY